jgi:8-oxo-dGTP pyrophosphatase MutT (NUDIX family)
MSSPLSTEDFGRLPDDLLKVLLGLHSRPYPHVPNPANVKKRASVALVLRIRPHFNHWPDRHDLNNSFHSKPRSLEEFFSQSWVKHGDPEALFIKRAARAGDRWTSHVALPGGRRDPEDEDDKAAAIRETSEEVGLDLTTSDSIYVSNLPERIVTTSWGKVPYVCPLLSIPNLTNVSHSLMVLCPFIFLLTSPDVPLLRLQPTEVASTHWVSLRALLSPSLRTVEYVDVSDRLASQGGFVTRSLFRSIAGRMMFSAIRLTPTESLQCSSIPNFVPGEQAPQKRNKSLIEKAKSWCIGDHAGSPQSSRPLLLWGLTLGVLADFLDMIPPNNAVELWNYPTFTAPDLRLILWLMTHRLRYRNLKKLNQRDAPNQTAMDGETVAVACHESAEGHYTPNDVGIGGLGVGRYYGNDKQGTQSVSYAVGIMLDGYYDRVRHAIALFLAMRLALGTTAAVALVRWFRRR